MSKILCVRMCSLTNVFSYSATQRQHIDEQDIRQKVELIKKYYNIFFSATRRQHIDEQDIRQEVELHVSLSRFPSRYVCESVFSYYCVLSILCVCVCVCVCVCIPSRYYIRIPSRYYIYINMYIYSHTHTHTHTHTFIHTYIHTYVQATKTYNAGLLLWQLLCLNEFSY